MSNEITQIYPLRAGNRLGRSLRDIFNGFEQRLDVLESKQGVTLQSSKPVKEEVKDGNTPIT